MKKKQLYVRFEVKSLNEDGTFEGCLSPYNNVDLGGDVVEPGAFTKTLQDSGNTVPILWQHLPKCPIGELTLEDRPDGLWCKGKLLLEIRKAKEAYLLLKAGIIKGLSIGYDAVKAQVIDGVRHLKEIKLWEGSIVTFPMNTLAAVTDVKSLQQKGDFNEELIDRQLSDAGYQIMSALSSVLCQLPWSGLGRDEMLSAAEDVIQQFHDAYMGYLPNYLDYLSREYGIDTKSWRGSREVKAGRRISSATRGQLTKCADHVKSMDDILATLLEEEDDDDDEDESTSKGKSAAVEQKSEPDVIRSAAVAFSEMRKMLAQA